jgi:hypothetical protein
MEMSFALGLASQSEVEANSGLSLILTFLS